MRTLWCDKVHRRALVFHWPNSKPSADPSGLKREGTIRWRAYACRSGQIGRGLGFVVCRLWIVSSKYKRRYTDETYPEDGDRPMHAFHSTNPKLQRKIHLPFWSVNM